MKYRINERNLGHTTLNGEPKKRSRKEKGLNPEEKRVVIAVLERVYNCMEKDVDFDYIDGGNFTLVLNRSDYYWLGEAIDKLGE